MFLSYLYHEFKNFLEYFINNTFKTPVESDNINEQYILIST